MVILGLLLVGVGAVAILAAVFSSSGEVELLGLDLTALGMFLVGVGAGAAVLWGFTVFRFGTRRELKARRERKELNELSAKLERAEADRRRDETTS